MREREIKNKLFNLPPSPPFLPQTVNKDDLFEARLRVGVAAEDINALPLSASASPSSTLPPELVLKVSRTAIFIFYITNR